MRMQAAAIIVATLALAASGPAAADPPTGTVIDQDDPVFEAEIAALLTDECGVPVAADTEGRVIVFERTSQRVPEMSVFHLRATFTNLETGQTARLIDAGPDQLRRDPRTGELSFAIIGRSTTGSGVIGRVVEDADGNVIFQAGREYGDWVAGVCAQLT